MEFATAALASLGSAVSGIGSSLGSAFGMSSTAPMNLIPGSVAGGSTALNILQGGMGLVGAMSAMRAGQAQASALRGQAADARLQADQTEIDATERETSLRKALIASLGERDVAYAASGVDLSFGTPVVARREAIDDANRAITMSDQKAAMNRAQLLARASSYDAAAADAEDASWLKAAGTGLGTAFDIWRRG